MQAVTHASPIFTLHILNVKGTPKYYSAQHYNADEAEVNTPQYVFFYIQFLFVSLYNKSALLIIVIRAVTNSHWWSSKFF